MKPFHPTRRQFRSMFRPKIPDLNKLLLHKLTSHILDLKKTMEADLKPETHTTQREGVYYQLHERNNAQVPSNPLPQPRVNHHQTPSVPTRRLMGFKAFCEKLDKKAETPTLVD